MQKAKVIRKEDIKDIQQGNYTGEAALVMLINKKGEVLLNLRDDKPNILYPKHWAILGGSVEKDETPEETAYREVKEEAGHIIKGPIKEYAKIIDREGKNQLATIFVATINKEISELRLGEGQALKYYPPKEIQTIKVTPFLKEVILHYFFKKN